MILQWMVYSALIALLLSAAAFGAEVFLRQRRRQARWVWVIAMVSCLGIPAAALSTSSTDRPSRSRTLIGGTASSEFFTGVADIGRSPSAGAFATFGRAGATPGTAGPNATPSDPGVVPPGAGRAAQTVRASPVATGSNRGPRPLPSPRLDPSAFVPVLPEWNRPLVILWATGSALVVLFLVASGAGLSRWRRRWPAATLDGHPVLVSDDSGPAVVGFFPGEIVVPRWLFTADPVEREMALAHESEHLARRDPSLLLISVLLCAALPWNPALWWMCARLRQAVEVDCDLRVLARGANPRSYGRFLIFATERTPAGRFAVCALSAPSSFLERRIRLMLARKSKWSGVRATVGLAAAASFALVARGVAEPVAPPADRPVTLSVLPSTARPATGPALPPDRLQDRSPEPAVSPSLTLAAPPPAQRPTSADTIPEEMLARLRRRLTAAALELERLGAGSSRERVGAVREELIAAIIELEGLGADPPHLRALEEAARNLEAISERLQQARLDTLDTRRRTQMEASMRAAEVETARRSAAAATISAQAEALGRALEARQLELTDSIRTDSGAALEHIRALLATESRLVAADSSLRAGESQRLQRIAETQLLEALEAIEQARANEIGDIPNTRP